MNAGLRLLPFACKSSWSLECRENLNRTLTLIFLCLKLASSSSTSQLRTGDVSTHDIRWKECILEACDDERNDPSSLFSLVCDGMSAEDLDALALTYFAMAKQHMRAGVLSQIHPQKDVDVESLHSDWIREDDETSRVLAEAANADLGQQCFRDLIVSFQICRSIMLPRQTVLLDRTLSRAAEQFDYQACNNALAAANQSPSNVWERGLASSSSTHTTLVRKRHLDEEVQMMERRDRELAEATRDTDCVLEHMCAMLSGVFVSVVKRVDDARTSDAFGGLLELPFFQCNNEVPDDSIRLFAHAGIWYAYSLPRGKLKVHVRGSGLRGLCSCAAKVVAYHNARMSRDRELNS